MTEKFVASSIANTKRDAISAAWDKNGTVVGHLGLMVAPEIFTTAEDLELPSGRVVPQGSKYFDWNTAMALSNGGLLGKGWRLPTALEAELLATAIAWQDVAQLRHGYLGPNDMTAYRRIPSATLYTPLRSECGLVWTSTAVDEMHSYYAEIDARNALHIGPPIYRFFGLIILCVKDNLAPAST